MDEKAKIRYAVLVEEKSQRQVAREMGCSRNTVRKMLEDSNRPSYQQSQKRMSPVLGPYKATLERWVEEDGKKPKKKRRTASRMYQLLQEEHGYRGSEPTVRVYVGKLRRKAKHKVYIQLAYEAGETGQVDFGEAEVTIAGRLETAHLFLMWLGYSGATVVQAYPAETQEIFFAGHVAAFDFFGGVPQELWYDNLANAVRKVLKGPQREEQESFISFRTHYLFRAEFCNPASGWEKGGVEGKVGYVRRNWLIGAGEFESWETLNSYLRDKCRQEQGRQLQGRSQTIGERLQEEQEAFRPLPERPYRCCKTVPVRANQLSLVSFGTWLIVSTVNRIKAPKQSAVPTRKKFLAAAFDNISAPFKIAVC
jgi:transposase